MKLFKNQPKEKTPPQEDIGLKVASHEVALWTEVVKGYEEQMKHMEKQLQVNLVFLHAAKDKLAQAEAKDAA